MIHQLTEKLWAYIITHHPELMMQLQQDNAVTRYLEEKVNEVLPRLEALILEGKPEYVITELCLNELTAELKPSRFDYIMEILEDEFRRDYETFSKNGILAYEVINMMQAAADTFEQMGFSEDNKEHNKVYYAIVGSVAQYLEQQKQQQ